MADNSEKVKLTIMETENSEIEPIDPKKITPDEGKSEKRKKREARKRKAKNERSEDPANNLEILPKNAEEILNIETKRSKRKKNHNKKQEGEKDKSKNRDKIEVAQYLECWKNDSESWKFHKVKQVYIQNNIFDDGIIEDETWPIALEYLSGTKGAGKDALLKSAQNIIKHIDEKNEDSDENPDLVDSAKYKRARELLQMLN